MAVVSGKRHTFVSSLTNANVTTWQEVVPGLQTINFNSDYLPAFSSLYKSSAILNWPNAQVQPELSQLL